MSSLISLLVYAVIMVVAGLVLARNKNVQDFLIAGRANAGWVMAAGITAAWVDATWFVFYGSIGFTYGWGILIMVAGMACGFLTLGAYVDKIKALSTEHNMITFADWFRFRYGRPTGVLVGISVSCMFLIWLSCVLVGAGLIFSSIFDLHYEIVVLTIGLLTVPLILKGGYAGLTRFDVLQFMIIAVLLGYVFLFGFRPDDNLALQPFRTIATMDPVTALSLFLTCFAATFATGDVWQRVYAARNPNHVRAGCILAALFVSIGFCAAAALGMFAKSAGYSGVPEEAFVWLYKNLFNPGAQSVFFIILLAAVMSTLNVTVYGAASSFAKDYVKNIEGLALKRRIQWITISVVGTAMIVALTYRDIMTLGLSILSVSTCILPLMFFSLTDRIQLHPASAFWSTLLGFAVFLGLIFTGTMTPEYSGLPVVVNLAAIGLVEGVYFMRKAGNATR